MLTIVLGKNIDLSDVQPLTRYDANPVIPLPKLRLVKELQLLKAPEYNSVTEFGIDILVNEVHP